MAAPFDDPLVASLRDAFQEGLRALGYTQGENVDVVERWATGAPEAYDKVAADLLGLGVDIIVASGGPAIVAAKQATQTIPIVVTASADIAKTGLVSSLARPGGNITGLSFMAPDLAAKRLQLLTEAIPGLTRVSTIWNPAERANVVELEQVQIAAQSLRVDLQSIEAASLDRLPDAFAAAQGPHSGLMLFSHVFVINNRSRFIEIASQHRLPTIYGFKRFVADGGLMSYGPDLHDLYRRAPTYVDKILKGANPAELPIEQPTEFELVVNLKTAQALGATIPQVVIGQASEVVQ
jgi:putative tryptophan/tyrosine transport system substrate-binding protein